MKKRIREKQIEKRAGDYPESRAPSISVCPFCREKLTLLSPFASGNGTAFVASMRTGFKTLKRVLGVRHTQNAG